MIGAPHQIPEAAWTRRLDDQLETPGKAGRPPLSNIIRMLPFIFRVWRKVRKIRQQGREPVMDPFTSLNPGPYMGVPLGGLGSGTITRGWLGEFTRWQMQPGSYFYHTVAADQFSLYVKREGQAGAAQVLNASHPENAALNSWQWGMPAEKATYYALFPRAWTVYEEIAPGIRLTSRQISPVLPHNYMQSTTPAGVFVWRIENDGSDAADVSLMFTFQNGTGAPNDYAGGHANAAFTEDFLFSHGAAKGVLLKHVHRQERKGSPAEPFVFEDPLTFVIAARDDEGIDVTCRSHFVTTSDGMDIWGDFSSDGRLDDFDDQRPSSANMAIGAAVCASVHVPAGETREVVFTLGWDMPIARFGEGRAWYRRYTRFYGRDGEAAPYIARDALDQYTDWEAQIEAWQEPVLEDPKLPDWYKCALFNETYYLVDGGTVWVDEPVEPIEEESLLDADADDLHAQEFGHFAYLEGHEYRMYNTYDVHFYASFALTMLWPEIAMSVQRDYAKTVQLENTEQVSFTGTKSTGLRKTRGAVPHDLGAPGEDLWIRINSYSSQDISRWKDLNTKFVLQVYRDFTATQDINFLVDVWDAVTEALKFMEQFDTDGDGMIENEGYPDQTYDAWTAVGVSAYTGGLWAAALQAAARLAQILDKPDEAYVFDQYARRAASRYHEKLWEGSYYLYDSGGTAHSNSVMADQLAGDWYSRSCGLGGVVPEENAKRTLQTVYSLNVLGFRGGEMGAVNGMRPDGKLDRSSIQSQEVWTGTTFSVAASMIQLGLVDEGFATAYGIYRQIYEKNGYWFMTPEALLPDGSFRSLSYMRPLAIWAMQWAWQRHHDPEDLFDDDL